MYLYCTEIVKKQSEKEFLTMNCVKQNETYN